MAIVANTTIQLRGACLLEAAIRHSGGYVQSKVSGGVVIRSVHPLLASTARGPFLNAQRYLAGVVFCSLYDGNDDLLSRKAPFSAYIQVL
eukprot:1159085-Pelagomonas_calceolata.AAC.2